VKKWIVLILLYVFSFTSYAAKEEPEQLYAQSAVLMDAENGRVLFEKNGDDKKAMASTTKIMTCILALEYGDENDIVTFSENAQKQPKVHLGARAGEQFYLKDLLYSLMLESHNDVAVAIAESISGDVKKFADEMNKKAKEIGCNDTYFITPNGLDATDGKGTHSTTAVDLAKIMSYCVLKSTAKNEFLKITSTHSYSFSNLAGTRSYSCTNHNAFLSMMKEAISGKTGFTSDAGYCYVGAVESEGRTFVVSLLACGWPNNKNYKWADMKKLVTYGMEKYHWKEYADLPEAKEIEILNGIPEDENLFENAIISTRIEQKKDEKVLLHDEEEIDILIEQVNELHAPVTEGRKVGRVVYLLNSEILTEYPIVLTKSIPEKSLQWYFQKIVELYVRK